MVRKENLVWILDYVDENGNMCLKDSEEEYKVCVDFSHSLGLKCDSVGWTELDMTRPDTGEILDKIEAFCKENGMKARGGYSMWYEDFESDWYLIDPPYVKGYYSNGISAHNNRGNHILRDVREFCVSDRFRKVCLENNVPGLRFSWYRDVGRYEAMQFFRISGTKSLSRIAYSAYLSYSDEFWIDDKGMKHYSGDNPKPRGAGSKLQKELAKFGKHSSRLADIFYNLRINTAYESFFFPADEMPDEGIVHAIAIRRQDGSICSLFIKRQPGYCSAKSS